MSNGNDLVVSSEHATALDVVGETKDFVTATIDNQLFGIPVLTVQDVLGPQKITRIPLAPPEIAGSLNLRGRIVTAIDLRSRLNLSPRPDEADPEMSIVVDLKGELYSLLVDEVGEVLSVPESAYERNPATLHPSWREHSQGVYRLKDMLLVVLDVSRMLEFANSGAH